MNETDLSPACSRFDRWLTAYLDDELDAVHTLEVEEHLADCEICRERVALDRAVRGSLRRTRPVASEALRRRAAAALLAKHTLRAAELDANDAAETSSITHGEDSREARPATSEVAAEKAASTQPRLVRLRYVAPLVAAAAVALFLGANAWRPQRDSASSEAGAGTSRPTAQAHLASTFDRFLDDLIDAHMQPPPPEVTDDDGLTRLNPFVGVRVSRPELTALGARFLGARMHHRQAAMLQYAVGDRRRVTLYVFDPARVPVDASRLERRVVENRSLFLGHVRGFTVAASERDGVGYALASDLNDQETEKAIVMAAR